MKQADAVADRADLRDWVAAPGGDPVDVELDLDRGRERTQEQVPDRRLVEPPELERMVVVAQADPTIPEYLRELRELGREPPDVVGRLPVVLGHPGHDGAGTIQRRAPFGDAGGVLPEGVNAFVRGDDL